MKFVYMQYSITSEKEKLKKDTIIKYQLLIIIINTGCGPEDLPEAMNDREKWRERVRDIRACGTI